MPEMFVQFEIIDRIDEKTPYTGVFLQECERFTGLIFEMRRSLIELDMGLKGDLSMTEAMEELLDKLFNDNQPLTWKAIAWPSLRSLSSWLVDFHQRYRQIAEWANDLQTPKVTWLPGFFNPQAFINAVMQVTARKNEWPLDKLSVTTDITKRQVEEIETATRDGAYVHGLYCEGARWDVNAGVLEDARMKELFPLMPVIQIKAATVDKMDARDIYKCPAYKTQFRGPELVFFAGLRTKAPPAKWIMAGVGLLLDVIQ